MRYGVLPRLNGSHVAQGTHEPGAQEPGTHGRLRGIQHIDERALGIFLHGAHQFEVALGFGIQGDVLVLFVPLNPPDMRHGAFLRLLQVMQHRARCQEPGVHVLYAEALQRVGVKMLGEGFVGKIVAKDPVLLRRNRDLVRHAIGHAALLALIDEDLGGGDGLQEREHIRSGHLGDGKLARRCIQKGYARGIVVPVHSSHVGRLLRV